MKWEGVVKMPGAVEVTLHPLRPPLLGYAAKRHARPAALSPSAVMKRGVGSVSSCLNEIMDNKQLEQGSLR